MKRVVLIVGLACLVSAVGAAGAEEGEEPIVSKEKIVLFNGKNLDGWKPKFKGHEVGDNYLNTFRVEDGILKVCYDKYEKFDNKFGHLFYEKPFSNYVIRVEYRFVGDQIPGGPGWAFRNNGIMVHGQTPESMGKGQSFPDSIEIQLLGGKGAGERSTANLCTPGTHVVIDGKLVKRHCISSRSKTYHGDQWVTVEAEVRGNKVIRHKVEGETVLEYNQPQLNNGKMLYGGTISIQAETHPTEFRKIELWKLEK